MSVAFEQLKRASFFDIEFAIARCSVKGGLRDHVHEYPKTPGGSPEKLGRRLYQITMDANFSQNFEQYGPDYWPGQLAALRLAFENEETGPLHIPTIGTIQAYCINWSQEMTSKILSGEMATFEFREDQSSLFLVTNIVQVSASSLGDDMAALSDAAAVVDLGDLFDSMSDAVSSVTSLIDTAELFGDLALSKISGVVETFVRLDQTTIGKLDPTVDNIAFIEAFMAAWLSATNLKQDILRQSTPIVDYKTPTLMAIGDVSRVLYGDASRASELLTINAIEDAFAIPAGTSLRVFAQAA